MSFLKTIAPSIVHTPAFGVYKILGRTLAAHYHEANIETPFPWSDTWYYHTDDIGLAGILPNLVFNSNLYKPDKFDCEDYALKAQVLCAERYGLNTLRYTYGTLPLGAHGFNTMWVGDRFLIFEPNLGMAEQLDGNCAFEMGQYGYLPKVVLL